MSKAIAILVCTVAVLAASYGALATPAEMTGVETAVFADREVVVIRHTGGVTVSTRCLRDFDARTLTITLSNLRAKEPKYLAANQPTLASVKLSPVAGKNVILLKLALTDSEVIERGSFRYGSYSEHVVLVELFSPGVRKEDKAELRNLEALLASLLGDKAGEVAVETPRELEPGKIVMVEADPGQALERMHSNHLLSLDTRLTIIAEGEGAISSDQGERGLRVALDEGAVSEVVFVGNPEAVESVRRFLRTTRFRTTALNLKTDTERTLRPASASSASAIENEYPRMRVDDEWSPFSYRQLKGQLSDILVNLPATSGYNFYSVLMLLSEMAGVSIIVDPYLVDPPTGSRRGGLLEPPGGGGEGGEGGAGFRGAERFQARDLHGATNTVIGNFENVPFDLALQIILEAHDLDYLVFSTPESDFTKPVILVSSRERIEQEIARANEIDLYQEHYADPVELYNALDSMGLLPSRERGWYVYRSPYSGGDGGGRGGRGGGNGGGRSGGGSGGGGSGPGGGGGIGPTGCVMGQEINPHQKQALILQFDPETRDERLAELMSLAASEELSLLSVSFVGGEYEDAGQGRMLVIVLG